MSAETDVLEQLVQRSHSPDAEVRSAAVKQILELPDEALLQLLERHSRSTGSARRRLLVRRMIGALPYAVFALAIAGALSRDPSADPRMHGLLLVLCVCLATGMLLTWGYYMRSVWVQVRAKSWNSKNSQRLSFPMVMLLAGRTDRRFLPFLLSEIALQYPLFERPKVGTDMVPPSLPLAPAFSGGAKIRYPTFYAPHEFVQDRRRYRKIVQGILAQIRPEETIELTAEEQSGLLLLLYIPEEDVNLTLCILARLPCWGDAQAVPILKRLIREKHWYVGSEQVETAARRCLEELETRLKRQNQGSTLLRPVEGNDATPPAALLRPAGDAAESAPEQLLRPTGSPPPGDSQ